jgi:hypothetical protein
MSDRCYIRGLTWLGLLNTVIGCLFNRVLIRHIDTKTRRTVKWSVGIATDFPPGPDE